MEDIEELGATSTSADDRDKVADFAASLLVPGLGQWLQGRRGAGVHFLLEFAALAIVALAFPAYAPAAWTAATVVVLISAGEAAYGAARRPRG